MPVLDFCCDSRTCDFCPGEEKSRCFNRETTDGARGGLKRLRCSGTVVCRTVYQRLNKRISKGGRVLKRAFCGEVGVSRTDTFTPKQGKTLGKYPRNQGIGPSNIATAANACARRSDQSPHSTCTGCPCCSSHVWMSLKNTCRSTSSGWQR